MPRSSLIRFAQAFGFDGFSAMQRVSATSWSSGPRLCRADSRAASLRRRERPGLGSRSAGLGRDRRPRALRGTTPPEQIERAVTLLAAADTIHVVGQRRAFAVAAYLAYAIGQLGSRTYLLDGIGGMTMHQADLMARRDALIAVSFSPYAPETLDVCRRAAERGIPVLAVTDGPLSPLVPLASVAFEIEDAELQGFRALSATMCLALTLVVRLGQRAGERVRKPSPSESRPALGSSWGRPARAGRQVGLKVGTKVSFSACVRNRRLR